MNFFIILGICIISYNLTCRQVSRDWSACDAGRFLHDVTSCSSTFHDVTMEDVTPGSLCFLLGTVDSLVLDGERRHVTVGGLPECSVSCSTGRNKALFTPSISVMYQEI